jgi:predicted enzyme related to lactoylglutathione lyase
LYLEIVLIVKQAVGRIEKLGGKLVLPKRAQGKNGLFANVVDIEGNRFGIYQWLGNTPSE